MHPTPILLVCNGRKKFADRKKFAIECCLAVTFPLLAYITQKFGQISENSDFRFHSHCSCIVIRRANQNWKLKCHYPRVSPGDQPLTKSRRNSGLEIAKPVKKLRAKINRTVVPVMSLNAVMEDLWQSTARSTIREKCKSIFNKELLSDAKFVVRDSKRGSESKKIPAHKFVLAISSPVFYAMFYGELAEKKDSIEISDCGYESLLELFRFIYSDEANLTPDNVMQLMYLPKKYMLPSLADKCTAFLQENLDAASVFHVLPDAQKYEEKDLLDHCWKVIEKETDEAVKSDGFVTIERSVLEE